MVYLSLDILYLLLFLVTDTLYIFSIKGSKVIYKHKAVSNFFWNTKGMAGSSTNDKVQLQLKNNSSSYIKSVADKGAQIFIFIATYVHVF